MPFTEIVCVVVLIIVPKFDRADVATSVLNPLFGSAILNKGTIFNKYGFEPKYDI